MGAITVIHLEFFCCHSLLKKDSCAGEEQSSILHFTHRDTPQQREAIENFL